MSDEDDIDYGLKLSRQHDANSAYVNRILDRATWELATAQMRFPQPNYVTLKVAEEAGEVIKEAVHYAEGRSTWEKVEGDVVQMIAMGLRLLVEGDQINGVKRPVLIFHKMP